MRLMCRRIEGIREGLWGEGSEGEWRRGKEVMVLEWLGGLRCLWGGGSK